VIGVFVDFSRRSLVMMRRRCLIVSSTKRSAIHDFSPLKRWQSCEEWV